MIFHPYNTRFPTLAASAATAVAALSAVTQIQAATQPPNIVFIFSDDHTWQAVSCYGDERKLIDTPNIDRIARNGIKFDRCLVPNPICGPSRACVLTGAYSHVNGFLDNRSNTPFNGAQPTLPNMLQKAGYQTAIIGKWHLVSDPVGFDFWQVLPDQGEYYNPKMIRNGQNIEVPGYVTDIITDASIEWLENRDKRKPFLLMSHHKAPHHTYVPAVRHLDFDKGRVYKEPKTLYDDYSGRGPAERNQRLAIGPHLKLTDLKFSPPPNLPPELREQWDAYYDPIIKDYYTNKPEGEELLRWKYQRYMHDYLSCVRTIDENVGKLLDYLEREGLMENTIIIYASDQGFFLGEHGWQDKRWFYEESLRTPFVLSWPGVVKPGSVDGNMVSVIDFAPTLLEAAGVRPHERMQGRSLLPLLSGKRPDDWRTSFYYHFYENAYGVPPHYGVITQRYKLIHVQGEYDYWELFDRETDPLEVRNIYEALSYAGIRALLHKELVRLRRELHVPGHENDVCRDKIP